MIEKLRVRNFRSLKDLEVMWGKFNVLMGPNNSGKSNILDCLAFLSETCRKPVMDAFGSRGGFEKVVFGGRENGIEFAVDLILDGETCQYVLSCERGEIREERLVLGAEATLERDSGRAVVVDDDGLQHEVSVSGYQSTLVGAYGNREGFSAIRRVCDCLGLWRVYQFASTDELRGRFAAREVLDLGRYCENLVPVLVSLRNGHPDLFSELEGALRQGIPDIDSLLTPLTPDGEAYLAVRERAFDPGFDSRHLSDGTLKFLAYVTASVLPHSGLACFEELENSLHPGLLKVLVQVLKKSDKQVILSTQSPYAINFIEPGEVRVVEKRRGETHVRVIDEVRRLRDTLRVILS